VLPIHGPLRPFQFEYFDALLGRPEWAGARVLDFGGRGGAILRDPRNRIDARAYWCIDFYPAVVAAGRRSHPDGHFVEYDEDVALPSFDLILAYSVFTRASRREMRPAVDRLSGLLAPGGRLAFTFLDPWWTAPPRWVRSSLAPPRSNLHWCLDRYLQLNPGTRLDVTALVAATAGAGHITLNGDGAVRADPDDADGRGEKHIAFYTVDYMRRHFPEARVVPPVRPERQHGAVILR
jgi:SAM-dependent methyltransferase